jgi:hypothetical protein
MPIYKIITDAVEDNTYQIDGDTEMDAMINWVAYCLDECAEGRIKDYGEIISVEKIDTNLLANIRIQN